MSIIIVFYLLFILSILFLLLSILYYKKYKIYKYKCTKTTNAIIINYKRFNISEIHETNLIPIYTYTVNGKKYTHTNDVCTKKMIKKDIVIKYCEQYPQYSYIEKLGMPHFNDAAKLFVIFAFLCFIGTIIMTIIIFIESGNMPF